MKQWVKLHTEILNDPKIGRMSFADKGIWLCLIALAGKLDDRDDKGSPTGRLDTMDNVAWHLRAPIEELLPALERMTAASMLHQDEDAVIFVTHFAERQANDTDAERMQRYRQRNATSRKSNATVTQPLRDRDDSESESEQNRKEQTASRAEQTRAREARTPLPAAAVAHPPACGGTKGGPAADELANTPSEIDRATKALTAIGVDPMTTRALLRTTPYAAVIGWTNYVPTQKGLHNPAGYVVKMLQTGEPPPQNGREPPKPTWYTDEEYQTLFYHGEKETDS